MSSEHARLSSEAPDVSRWEWAEMPAVRPAPTERTAPTLAKRSVPAAILAVALWLGGHPGPASAVVATSAVSLGVAFLRPQWSRVVDDRVGRVTRPVSVVTSMMIAGALQVLVFMPVALVSRALGRDPLRTKKASSYWIERSDSRGPDLRRRQFGLEARPASSRYPTRSVSGFLRSTVVLLSSVLIVNLFAGVVYELAHRKIAQTKHPLPIAAPALAGQPMVGELDAETMRLKSRWDPLMGSVREDFVGRQINIHQLTRLTFEPPSAPGGGTRVPQVFFFGGSTMFGTGQRDLYTVPSQVARRSDAEGHPIDAVNYGQGGFVIWQEVELLERLLTTGHVPDVVVFYNGANEISTQVSELSDSPSYTQAAAARRLLQAKPAASAVYDAYARHSVIHKLRNRLRGPPPRPATPSIALTEARAHNAVVLHARAVAFIQKLATAYGFRPLFFWQPTVFDKEIGEGSVMALAETSDEDWGYAYRAATAQVAPPVVDLTDALDSVSRPVFFDRVHTNELGAGVVADAMYQAIVNAVPV